MTPNARIAILGAGPGGLMLARLLQCRGVSASIFEREAHPDERPQGGSLDLHARTGQRAMRKAGLDAAFLAAARPEDQDDRLYDPQGTLLLERDGSGDDRPEIDRTALRRILLASVAPGTVRWGQGIETVAPSQGGGYDVTHPGGVETFDIVVGADGAWSRARRLLSAQRPVYEGVALVDYSVEESAHPSVGALVGRGKMMAVGENRALIGQRNGDGHIRLYALRRMAEGDARGLMSASADAVRAATLAAFSGWAPQLRHLIDAGTFSAVRPLYALPVGYRWESRAGVTLLGDAAHVMAPFGGKGVNLALADAADLADALCSGEGWAAVTRYEALMAERAAPAAAGAAAGLNAVISSDGLAHALAHYQARTPQ
ncbi:FAD-dependent monooxygenase [Gluconacetobacter azotocaptans]|uniref:FAD-dependent monooxygenase n=1 Tax=Gluconacetobacter azotocaptans TaxID=142834 RepID=A0A7W4JSQ4_9PROT|nr:NAD(P)/FAD-dependent oxidoreductase [Gluconacetobacter azotocaptans]MBB2190236.1 FAD-dependent monooxygenase [Gluconacetobacter azotocaptans]GBQ35868.1 salicylate 1-monooxygenase [Gluconacetobacter azotocaptans DSM 13594]